MDDYSLTSLTESKNEWCARLVSLLTHHIIIGIDSIFNEALTICLNENEDNKYLMTFQNLLSTIPNWNPATIETERKRIEASSGCKYLEDLITCVHIIQLKALTCIRVGQKQKKIDINIPSVDKFIHNVYINVARKLYTNIFLFEKDLYPLQIQKNKHEVEYLVKEAILLTIRDNIPVEKILQCYMEENEEVEISNEVPIENDNLNKIETSKNNESTISNIPIDISSNPILTDHKLAKLAEDLALDNKPKLVEPEIHKNEEDNLKKTINNIKENINLEVNDNMNKKNNLTINFSDNDTTYDINGNQEDILKPKDLDTLAKISDENNYKRKIEEAEEENGENDKLNIGADTSIDIDIVPL